MLLANAFSAGMMFLASVFISRYGGKDLFGFFSVLLGLIISATPVVTFGLDTAIVRFLPQYRSEGKRHLVGGMQRFVILFAGSSSTIAGILLALVLVEFRNYSWQLALVAGGCLPLAVMLTVLQSTVRADGNVSRAVAGEAVVRPFVFGAILLLLHFFVLEELSLLAIIGAYALALLSASVVMLILVVIGRHINWNGDFHPKTSDIRLWFQLGLTVLFSNLSIALINQAPVIVAGTVMTAFDAGELGAVIRLAMLVAFALTAVNSVITPFLSRAMTRGDKSELQSLVTRATAFSLMIAVPVCTVFFVFAPLLMSLFGDDYQGAVPYLRTMLIAYVIHASAGPGVTLLNMTGIHRAATKIVFGWAMLTVLGLFVAVSQVGMLGAVGVSAVSVAGYPILLAILCRITLGVDPTIFSLRFLLRR